MSTLDDKLREILKQTTYASPADMSGDEAIIYVQEQKIAQIKAAFADEVMPLVNQMAELSYQPRAHFEMPETYLTGYEFYARFEKEFKTYAGDYSQGWQEEVLEVAKRAAGIDESKD